MRRLWFSAEPSAGPCAWSSTSTSRRRPGQARRTASRCTSASGRRATSKSYHAATTLPRRRPVGAVQPPSHRRRPSAARARRRRTNSTNSSPRRTITTPSTITAVGAFELSGVQNSCPLMVALLRADLDRHLPVEDQRALARVLDLCRRDRRHPVDAMIVPFELAGAIGDDPVRRRVRARKCGYGHVGVEVLVQVVGGRAGV